MNFALFQLASQSSQTSPGRSASKAVDGDEATLPHTELDDSRPWWKVRLAYPIWVTNVEIVNTDDNGNRKWQDYVYIQCEYKSTKQKIKHLLREENKVKENKIS